MSKTIFWLFYIGRSTHEKLKLFPRVYPLWFLLQKLVGGRLNILYLSCTSDARDHKGLIKKSPLPLAFVPIYTLNFAAVGTFQFSFYVILFRLRLRRRLFRFYIYVSVFVWVCVCLTSTAIFVSCNISIVVSRGRSFHNGTLLYERY